jgi:hypothetical protein
MLATDAIDADLPNVDITGLDVALETGSLVLTMRLADPPAEGTSSSMEGASYLLVLQFDGDDGLGWTVSLKRSRAAIRWGA